MLGWIAGSLFIVIGVLNLILVHPVPGIFYLLFSLMYFPPITDHIKAKFNFSIHRYVKIVLGLMVLWATLAVSDLAEILGL